MPESTLAHYELLGLLGRGGMGEVHRARDTKLGREVAIKLLPEDFAMNPERMARFRREAKVLASLHHPNIASIFGLEEHNDRVFLVMELAEGSDLTQRISEGPVPEDEVLDIARQLAAGLEEAHEKSVVHRDLKPANIKLGTDGKVKILDFGLARALVGESTEEDDLENSPTITAAMSRAGAILGTAAYMSPEQARGRKVDRRADIWAFGVVLYEMLTGKRLFGGETISDTLAAVLRADIEIQNLPEGTSHGMRRLIERCLERDPLRRLRDIGEARVFLEDGAKDSSLLNSVSMVGGVSGEYPGAAGRQGLPVWATAVIAAVLAVAGLLVGWQVLGRSEPPQLFNTTLPKPKDGSFHLLSTTPGPAALSPDGTMVAYAARDASGKVHLNLRRLDSPEETILSGTENAAYPFWSPDSRYIGFATGEGKLKKVAVGGGPPVTLCAAENMKGGTWNEDGVILFAPSYNTEIHRVSASGGEPVAITALNTEATENSHRHPRFLPDGKHYLFLARVNSGKDRENRVLMGSLEGGEPQVITTSQTAAEYSKGHLLTAREGILLASPFDLKTGELGDGVPLVEDILIVSSGAACGLYSATLDGMLVYQTTLGTSEKTLEWISTGAAPVPVGSPGELVRPRISPDGTRAVVELIDGDTDANDLWLVDLESGLRTRFTFDPGDEYSAVWSSDGSTIFYVADVDTLRRIMARPVEGTGEATLLFEGTLDIAIRGVSPDGETLVISRDDPEREWNIYNLSIATGKLEVVVDTEDTDFSGAPSPDGRWLAYTSAKAGFGGIFVRPTSGGNRQWQVNQTSGFYPFWAPDGNTLYYIEESGQVIGVPVDGSTTTFRIGAPFPFVTTSPPVAGGIHVSLHPDGLRVLHVSGQISEDETGYLHLVTDWQRGLAN